MLTDGQIKGEKQLRQKVRGHLTIKGKKKKKKKPTFLARSPRSVQLYVRKMLYAILQSTSNEKMFIEGCYLVDIHNLSG